MSAIEMVTALIYGVWIVVFVSLVIWAVSRIVRGVWQRFRSS